MQREKPTILVTGGAGFIGGNFVLETVASGEFEVVNLDALTYAGNPETLAPVAENPDHVFVRGRIGDRELVDRLLVEYRPSAVVNFAAETHVDRSIDGPKAFIQTNVVETHELLEATLSYWGALEGEEHAAFRFLHVSTDEVYGTLGPTGYFTEESPFRPNSPYAASKAASDHLVRAYHHTYGLPTLITNCSNNYGPYHFPEKLIPLMILTACAAGLCRSTATGSRSGTGSTSRTTAGPFARCSSAAIPARRTTWAGTTSGRTSRSSRPFAPCSTSWPPTRRMRRTSRSSLSSPTDPATTGATP